MTKQELGPDDLNKLSDKLFHTDYFDEMRSLADARQSDRDELAALKNPLTAVMNDETKMLLVGERATNEQLRTQLAAAKSREKQLLNIIRDLDDDLYEDLIL